MKVAFSLLGPAYANIGDNRYYLLAAAVGLIWIALGSNMIGMKIGKWTENLGATWLSALIAILVIASGVGFVGGNGTASSRLPYSAAVDGLLPKAFARLPKWDTPYISTLALATVSTFLLVIYQLGDPMRVAYVELVSLLISA